MTNYKRLLNKGGLPAGSRPLLRGGLLRSRSGARGLLALGLLLGAGAGRAQTLEELKSRYPGDYEVVLDRSSVTRFYLEGGVPKAETKIVEKHMILDDRANGNGYNKFAVYHGDFDSVAHLEAYTDVPDGKSTRRIKVTDIKTEDAKDEEVFYDDIKKSEFDFPSLTAGAITYVSYTKTEKDLHLFSPFYFVHYLPVVHESYSVTFPSDMDVRFDIKNDSTHLIHIDKDEKGREHGLTFTATDVKPITETEGAPSPAWYEPHAIVRLGSYKGDDGAKVPFLENTKDLYHWDYGFISHLDSAGNIALKPLVDSLTRGLATPRAKAASIYSWVQHHIRYVAFENGLEGFTPRPAALVCDRRFGDCKDMASLLTAMCRVAGLNAYFTWIGTRDIPYDYADVPLPICDNHMISVFKDGDQWTFLDGTDPNCIFGYPSAFIQGKQALIAISPTEFKIIRVPVVKADSSQVTDSTFISWTGSGLHGYSSVYYRGYFGSEACNSLLFRDSVDTRNYVKSRMGKASNKFILGDYSIHYLGEADKTVNIQASWDVPGYGKMLGTELYINLNLEKFFVPGNRVDTAKRKVPIERGEYETTVDQYTLFDIPQGYTLNYLPKNYHYDDDQLAFSIEYTSTDSRVICRQRWINKSLMLEPDYFPKFNEAIRQILNQYKEQLVFVKKNGL